MINPKYIGIAATVGFVLSFLIGIFSGISFGLLLLRALICAAIFAAVGAGGSFLYQKFLSDGQSESVSDVSDASAEKASRVGGIVDIKIGDESLPEDEEGPRFNVSGTRPALRSVGLASVAPQAPVNKPEPTPTPAPEPLSSETVQPLASGQEAEAPVQKDSQPAFQPMNLVQATKSSDQPLPETAVEDGSPANASGAATPSASDGLEELPDISAFSGGEEADVTADDEDVVRDSEFAMGDEPRSSRSSSGERPAMEQSASVMAQAIRTILAKN